MKKFITIIIAFAMTLSMAGAVSSFTGIDREITNEQFVEMVENGEIPKNETIMVLLSTLITNITPLKELKDLEILGLIAVNCNDITPLSELTNLKGLTLCFGGDDLTSLSELTNLENLTLANTQVSDFTPLAGLTNLRYLWLDNNQINDITPLMGLTNLRYLELRNNPPISRQQFVELRNSLTNCSISSDYGSFDPGDYFPAEPDIFDALNILKHLVGIKTWINPAVYLFTPESKASGEPSIFDALEILKSLVGLPSLVG